MSLRAEPFPFIRVAGTPRERGRQYGAAAAARVARSAALYGDQLAGMGLDGTAVASLVERVLPQIEAFGAHYVEEMRGIAEGADLAFERVVLINARTEIIQMARLESGADDPDGCTGAVILPERSATGRLIHGQNWDWKAECAETAVVLRVERDDGPDILTFVEAGGLARCGMNAAGICVTANYLESERDYRTPGVPLALIRRKVLEQEHMAFAMKAVATTPKACSNNMMLSHVGGFAIDFECAPDESFPLYPDDGLLVHANHWVSPVALAKLKDTGIVSTPESFYRDWRVRRHLDAAGAKLAVDDLKQAFFDDYGTPHSVCRPPRPSERGNLSATVAMIVMDPAAGTMEVCPLPAINRRFTTYGLTDAAASAAAE